MIRTDHGSTMVRHTTICKISSDATVQGVCASHLSLLLSGCPLTVFDFVAYLSTEGAGTGFVGFELLPDDGEVWLVGGQAQHDQVSWEEKHVTSIRCKVEMQTTFLLSLFNIQHPRWCIYQRTIGSTKAVMCVGVVVGLSCESES